MNRFVVFIAALVWVGASSTDAAAQRPRARVGTKQSMDMVINRWVVDAEGQQIGPPVNALRCHLERVKTDKGWRTTVVLGVPSVPNPQQPISANPFAGGRVEFDEMGAFSIFDKDGHAVTVPSGLQPAGGLTFDTDWSGSLAASNSETARQARLAQVEARYGRSTGKVRGLSRYVRQTDEDLEELLLDANSGLPAELNVVHSGLLKGQVTFDYVEHPGRGLVRRAMRSETRLNEEGHRAVTTTEFTNVAVEQEN